jgi:DNA-binding transcriptional MerR regulator
MPQTKAKTKKRAGRSQDVVIPDKLYFRIGEVARLCRLPAYVLRFWETEFPQLKPTKSSTGQRMYRRRDIESLLRIKQLLYEEGFTIPGARQQLRTEGKNGNGSAGVLFAPASNPARTQKLKEVRAGLRDILTMLSARH